MTVLQAHALALDSDEYDVCIVGGGAVGLAMALWLGRQGHRIAVLESGDEVPDSERQELASVVAGGLPLRQDITSHPRRLGGATNEWGGRCIEHLPLDFEDRPWVQHSHWPIQADKLTRHYRAAADLIGVADLPAQTAADGTILESIQASDIEVESFRWSQAVAFASDWRSIVDAMSNVDVVLGANVVGFEFAGQTVDRVEVIDRSDRRIAIAATTVVVAAGGIENVRLLAHVRDQGATLLGGPQLGQRVTEHPKTREGGMIIPTDRFPVAWFGRHVAGGGLIQHMLRMNSTRQRQSELLNHAIYLDPPIHDAWIRPGYVNAKRLRSEPVRTRQWWRSALVAARHSKELTKYALAKRRGELGPVAQIIIVNQLEQPPDNGSSIRLGPDHDRYGVPIPVFDWRIGSQELESLVQFHHLLDQMLRDNDWGSLDSPFLNGDGHDVAWLNASHPMGGTRMSTSINDGVVDPDLRVHATTNLFVAGVSVLPTGGYANPTYTALALAHRLSERLEAMLPTR